MTRGVQTQLTEERRQRFIEDVRRARRELFEGAVEKYPAAQALVRILDAEALADAYLAQREALREIWLGTQERHIHDIAEAALDSAAVSVGSPETRETEDA